jgi:stage II sporulation protein D
LDRPIRVLISEKQKENQIKFQNPAAIYSEGSLITKIKSKDKITFEIKNDILVMQLGNKSFTRETFSILPNETDQTINFEGKKYSDSIRVTSNTGKILTINYVSPDEYLMGVLVSEMGNLSKKENLEALKAMMLCAKSFTFEKIRSAKTDYDVYSDIKDQLFNGVGNLNSTIREAYDSTKNLYLTFNDELAQVYYFSSCGGYTEDCKNVLPNCTSSYLQGVKDGEEPYCKISPSFSWQETITKKQLINSLVDADYIEDSKSKIKEFVIQSRYVSGRISELLLVLQGNNGERKEFILSGNKIRYAIKNSNGAILKSANFDIEAKYENQEITAVKLRGKGNGHGVGLCQWGAIGMAREGKKFDEIIAHYFNGVKITSKE